MDIRQNAVRKALDAIAMKPVLGGESGGHSEGLRRQQRHNDTKALKGMPQGVEYLVELSGIEPLASSLRTRRSPS